MQSAADSLTPADVPPVRDKLALVLALNGGAIVVAALYFGQELLVPLVLAGLLAFVLAPAASLLQRARLPRVAAVLLTVIFTFMVVGSLGTIVGRQAATLATGLPAYEAVVLQKWQRLSAPGGAITRLLGPDAAGAVAGAPASLSGGSTLVLARRFAQPLLGPLGTIGVVLIFTLFILLYSEDLRDRFVRLVGRRDLHRTIFALNDAGRRLSRYFVFQFLLNAGFGVWIAAMLALIGVPGALLWGILAAMMRFVPFIGTFVAVLPPLALALATAPGWTPALLVLALFLGSEVIAGQVVEPLLYGHSTGVSPIAIVVATSFWALLWGFVGLLIATPLTVCLVVIGRHVDSLAFFDVIFGDASPLLPPETFYQRALEGRSAVLEAAARAQIAAGTRAEYYDRVALRALALAQHDCARNVLTYERLEGVHGQIEGLIAALAPPPAVTPTVTPDVTPDVTPGGDLAAAVPEAWRQPGAVLCIPARGQLDDIAAAMAVQAMQEAGFGAVLEPNAVLDASGTTEIDLSRVRLCCLSVLEDSATAPGIRLFVRRMQKRMPDCFAVVGLWHSTGDSLMLAALRAEGQDEHLVLSIGELLAYAKAVSVQREQDHG